MESFDVPILRAARTIVTLSVQFVRTIQRGWLVLLFNSSRVVQPFPEFFPGLEERNVLLTDMDRLTGSGIARRSRLPLFDGKCAESTQLHSVATG